MRSSSEITGREPSRAGPSRLEGTFSRRQERPELPLFRRVPVSRSMVGGRRRCRSRQSGEAHGRRGVAGPVAVDQRGGGGGPAAAVGGGRGGGRPPRRVPGREGRGCRAARAARARGAGLAGRRRRGGPAAAALPRRDRRALDGDGGAAAGFGRAGGDHHDRPAARRHALARVEPQPPAGAVHPPLVVTGMGGGWRALPGGWRLVVAVGQPLLLVGTAAVVARLGAYPAGAVGGVLHPVLFVVVGLLWLSGIALDAHPFALFPGGIAG